MASSKATGRVSESLKARRELAATSKKLAKLNREIATQMIVLASQTGDVNALVESAEMLRQSRELFGPENTPHENAEIHLILASTLYQIARANRDAAALKSAITEYRHAITLASVTNNQALRARVRKDYARAKDLSRELGDNISRKGAA